MPFNARIGTMLLCLTAIALPSPVGAAGSTYDQARWDPIHFKPMIDQASDEDCLKCHQEVIEDRVLPRSPAGVVTDDTRAWYQTLDTYEGEQETFHRRHLVTPMARELMDLRCTTCHQGQDPRDETVGSSSAGNDAPSQRKQVDPEICLMCHGQFHYLAMGLPGPWEEYREGFKTCMTCHVSIRTVRHQVNFLKPEAIEAAGHMSGDYCYGCHGGRAWYRINFPYPRHPWPGSLNVVPQWAEGRPTDSDPRFLSGTQEGVPQDNPGDSAATPRTN